MFRHHSAQASTQFSKTTGSVIFIEPPEWVEPKSFQRPILFAFPQCFSPLAQACVRGMKDTVHSLLLNTEHHGFVDEGYTDVMPNKTDISPLQIACAEYVGSRDVKYLAIVKYLVSYGANLHFASFWVNDIDPLDKRHRHELSKRLMAMQQAMNKIKKQIGKFEERRREISNAIIENASFIPPAAIDQRERLNIDSNIQQWRERHSMILSTFHNTKQEFVQLQQRLMKRKLINPSPYIIALKDRQTSSDTSLMEAMVEGAIIIKDSALKAVSHELSEEIIQIVVEFVIGLPLNIWEV